MEQRIGHYRIVSELGRGGMGVVYEAHEESLNRKVAIKMLGSHLSEDASYVERFLREAQSAARLNHPNIVQIYAIHEDAGRHYFVMEYVPGSSLQRLIKERGRLDTVTAAGIILQAAAGLQEAHDHGIVHRDIKPANLMITNRGQIKITDFGLALAAGGPTRLTATGMMMGTPGYLSPEQCRDEDIDHRTDIYSLGVTFFESLTGSMPFAADSPLALIRKIVEVAPPDVCDLNPEVDQATRDILSRMMAKDRELRHGSCAELSRDLEELLATHGARSEGLGVGPVSGAPSTASDPQPDHPLNVDPTVVVDSGGAPARAETDAVPAETSPAGDHPPPSSRSARPSRLVLAALLVVALASAVAVAGAVLLVRGQWGRTLFETARRAVPAWAPEPEPIEPAATESSTPVSGEAVPRTDPVTDAAVEPGSEAAPPETRSEPEPRTSDIAPIATSRVAPSRPPSQEPFRPPPEVPSEPPPTAVVATSGVVIVAVGEPLLVGEAEAFLERVLARAGVPVVDESTIPGVEPLLAGDQLPPRGALREVVRSHARHVVFVRGQYLGERPLEYMGRLDVAYRTRLTVVAADLRQEQIAPKTFNETLEYTQLTVERVVREALGRWLRRTRPGFARER